MGIALKLALVIAIAVSIGPAVHPASAGSAADRVMAAGKLKCGVITEPLDWNKADLHGSLVALDAELCRAVSTALFGHPDGFDLQSYNTEREGLEALHKGQSDIIVGVTPSARDAIGLHVGFSAPFFEDGQGFMVHRDEGIKSLADLTGHKLCFIEDTDNQTVALTYLATHGIRPVPFGFQEEGEMDAAIMDRHCQATSALISKLAEARSSFRNSGDYVFLPDLLSLVPVTAAADADDARLLGILNATISALQQAEFLDVTQGTALSVPHSDDPRMQRLMGDDWATAQALGLPRDWSKQMIAAVGNYQEIFGRTIGPGTKFNLARGPNALWNKGGVMAPLPLQ